MKIIHVVPKLESGGIGMMLLNYYAEIDKSIIKFDFIVHGDEKGSLENQFISLGSRIFHVTPKTESLIKYKKEIKDILKESKYDIIHAHQNDMCFFSLSIAKKCGINIRIAHSHTSMEYDKKIQYYKHLIYRKLNLFYSTHLAYCGDAAKKWAFGKTTDGKLIVNGIDVDRFKFNLDIRNCLRKKYNIENDTIVLGMVNRLSEEKNIKYSIKIIKEMLKKDIKGKLFILGSGSIESELKLYVSKELLDNSVVFLGKVDNVSDYYNMFDCVLMPSFFEGFPVVSIESQCNGVKTLISQNISSEVMYSNIVQLGISENDINNWISEIINHSRLDEYCEALDYFKIKNLANDLETYYYNLYFNNHK